MFHLLDLRVPLPQVFEQQAILQKTDELRDAAQLADRSQRCVFAKSGEDDFDALLKVEFSEIAETGFLRSLIHERAKFELHGVGHGCCELRLLDETLRQLRIGEIENAYVFGHVFSGERAKVPESRAIGRLKLDAASPARSF